MRLSKKTVSTFFLVIASFFIHSEAQADDDEHERHERHEEKHEKKSVAGPKDPTYKAECGSCHMVYPPGLLPARSWQALMKGLDDHFGETASVDGKTSEKITQFLVDHAADHSNAKKSKKIANSIASSDTLIRVSETKYFIKKHREVRSDVWKRKSVVSRANCIACHPRAEQGNFSEDDVRIPK